MDEVRENKGDNGGVDALAGGAEVMIERWWSSDEWPTKKGSGQGEHFGPLGIFPRKVANVLTGEHLMNNAAMASVRLALICSALLFI